METKQRLKNFLLFTAAILSLNIMSCEIIGDSTGVTEPSEVDVEAAKVKVQEANLALGDAVRNARQLDIEDLEDLDDVTGFKEARDLYAEAFLLDPNNLDANLGYAVTQIILIKDDGELQRLRDEWVNFDSTADFDLPEVSLFKTSPLISQEDLSLNERTFAGTLYGSSRILFQDPPLASEMQDAVRNIVLPSFEISIERMNTIVESDSADQYTFIVTSEMQGGTSGELEEEPIELDLTDFKVFYASLLSTRAGLRVFLAYDLDVTSYDSTGITNALKQDSNFFTLKDANEMRRAKADLTKAANLVLEGITFLRNETDDQEDDFIRVDPAGDGDLDIDNLDEIETRVMEFLDAINGEVTLTEDWDDDEGTPDAELTISLNAFFDNPPQNPKQLLPSYMIERDTEDGDDERDQFVWTAQTFDAWAFPDPTFNGLLPAMTDTLLKEIFAITYVPGDIDLTIGFPDSSSLNHDYSWNDSPVYHLQVQNLSTFQTVWEIHGINFDNTIFSPVTHGTPPANSMQTILTEPTLTPGQSYRIWIEREGNGPFSDHEYEVRDFMAR